MPPEEEESIRDIISASFKGSDESDGVESSPVESDSKAASTENAQAAAADKKDVSKTATEANAGRDKKAAPANSAAPADQNAAKPYEPPAKWTKEEKETFLGLDPKVQKILFERNKGMEAHLTKTMMNVAQERARFEGIEKHLAARRESWSKEGVTDEQAIGRLFGYWDQSQKDPYGFVAQFVRERGLDMARFIPAHLRAQPQNGSGGQGGQQQPQYQIPPHVAQELQALRQQVGGVVSHLNGRAEHENRTVATQAKSEIDAFRDSADENGSPLYPFFDEVAADMSALIASGRASGLKDAYAKACRMNDSVDARMRETDEIKRKRQDEERRAAEAERSRRASVSLTPSTSGVAASSGSDDDDNDVSIRGLLRKGFSAAKAESRI